VSSSAQAIETRVRVAPRSLARSTETVAERIAPWVAGIASVWFALAAAWGMFGPIPAGHYGTMGGEGIIGENMVRWHILGPVWDYVTTKPTPAQYYCHHPWGGFWIQGIISAIFGHHNFVLPLPAVMMSSATPPLLYGAARAAWGKVPGAAAAVGFVFLPITLGFANFHNVEATVMFACALFFWGHAHMFRTWSWRYLLASVVGCALAATSDWPAFVMLATLLGVALVRGFLLPHAWSPPFSFRLYATWWVLCVTASVGFLALWVYLFARSDKLLDWLSAASTRGGGSSSTLAEALEARKHWIEISFTPLVIFLGKVATPLAVARLLWRRRDEEAYSLSFLTGATVSYVFFKQAADVHIFWSQYFGGYFALAFAQIIATVGDACQALRRVVGSKRATGMLSTVPLVLTAVFALVLWPDAARALRYARETGGRFNENGVAISSETNIIYVLYGLKDKLAPGIGPDVINPYLVWSWAYGWASAGEGRNLGSLPMERADPSDPRPIFLARASGLTLDQKKALVSKFHVAIYQDDVWVVDRREPPAPPDAYTFDEREPSPWEWYFIGGIEPLRTYVPDPFSTWEWRTHLGQPATAPDIPPKTLDQIRIAHNVAVAAGDTITRARLRNRLENGLDQEPATSFTQGVSLLGFHRIGGVEPRIMLLFEAAQPASSDASFTVHASVVRRKPLSLIPPDPIERDVAMPAALSTNMYRPGFVYSHTVVLRQRIGVERFWGSFRSKDGSAPPAQLDGLPQTSLLVAK
jgi:hypothetical protein